MCPSSRTAPPLRRMPGIKAMTVHQHTGEAVIADDRYLLMPWADARESIRPGTAAGWRIPRRSSCCSPNCGIHRRNSGAPGMSAPFTLCWQTVGNASHADCPGMVGYETRGQNGSAMTRSFISASAALPNTATRKRTGSVTGAKRSGRWRRRSMPSGKRRDPGDKPQ